MNELDKKLKEAAEIAIKKKIEMNTLHVTINDDVYYVAFSISKEVKK